MGRDRHPAPVVAALSATAGLVPDLKNPDFGAVAKAMGLWAHSISKAGQLEESVQTWLANPVPAAACNGETDAVSDVTLALRVAGDGGRHGGLHRQGDPARQGRRRPGDACEGRPLIASDETEIARPVFSEDNDNV